MAWEQYLRRSNHEEHPKVVIGLPNRGLAPAIKWTVAFDALKKPDPYTTMEMAGQPVDKARNLIVKAFLQTKSPWLFFLDTDVILGKLVVENGKETVVPDRNALTKMMSRNLPILTGVYYRRSDPPVPGIYKYHPEMKPAPGHRPIMEYPKDKLFPVDAVGAGALLVHRMVFERVPRPWFLFGDIDANEFSEDFYFNHKCLLPETLIYGSEVKPIKNVEIGDYVYTHHGTLKRVTNVFKSSFYGKMVNINVRYGSSIWVTPNHPILVKTTVPIGKFRNYHIVGWNGVEYQGIFEERRKKILWKEAKNLEVGDKIFFPKISASRARIKYLRLSNYINCDDLVLNDGYYSYSRTRKSALKVPKLIPLNSNLLRLFGYFIAEGSYGSNLTTIQFSLHKNEQEYGEDICFIMDETFGIKPTVSIINNGVAFGFSSKILGRLFEKLFGHGAKNKSLPPFWNLLDEKWLIELIKGLWRGDGHYQPFSTVSWKLAHQLKMALARLGILTSLLYSEKQKIYRLLISFISQDKFTKWFGISPKIETKNFASFAEEIDYLHMRNENRVSQNGGFWLKIKSLKEKKYAGNVYNLEVEDHNSYVAEGVTLHNCRKYGFETICDPTVQCEHLLLLSVSRAGIRAVNV